MTTSRTMPVAFLEDMNKRDRQVLANRIMRGFPSYFRTSTGLAIKISWSVQFCEFKITNSVCVATAYTADTAFRFISQLNQMTTKEQ